MERLDWVFPSLGHGHGCDSSEINSYFYFKINLINMLFEINVNSNSFVSLDSLVFIQQRSYGFFIVIWSCGAFVMRRFRIHMYDPK